MDLNRALDYLSQFKDSGIVAAADIDMFLRTAEAAQHDNAFLDENKPRIMLVGEFNSGKSTLLNALAGVEAAAVDILEMTSWVARYWKTSKDFCRITFRDGSKSFVDADDFKMKSAKREYDEQELEAVDRVDVGLPEMEPTCMFIDTPGMGAITRANERRLVEALGDADVILWTLDVDSVGSMRQSAFIQELRQSQVPLVVVLTKTDLLENPDEAEEIAEYVVQQFDIPRGRIFSTSMGSLTHVAGVETQRFEMEGVSRLREFIRNHIVPCNQELRRQAKLANESRVKVRAKSMVEEIVESLKTLADDLASYDLAVGKIERGIQAELEFEIVKVIRDSFFEGNQEVIREDLAKALSTPTKGGSLGETQITAIFRKHLGSHYFDVFWQKVVTLTAENAAEQWQERLQKERDQLESLFAVFQGDAWQEIQAQFTPEAIASSTEELFHDTTEKGINASLGVAALATAYAAWLGPNAAAVTLGAAATGVGLPIAAIGIGVAAFLGHKKVAQQKQFISAQVEETLNSYLDGFVDGVVKEQLFPRMQELNRGIGRSLVAQFRESLAAQLPSSDINALIENGLQCLSSESASSDGRLLAN